MRAANAPGSSQQPGEDDPPDQEPDASPNHDIHRCASDRTDRAVVDDVRPGTRCGEMSTTLSAAVRPSKLKSCLLLWTRGPSDPSAESQRSCCVGAKNCCRSVGSPDPILPMSIGTSRCLRPWPSSGSR